ncbi:MAG: hypothetical protein A3C13_00870 [Candidatus Lloydbacteria bacterium RIFCSPHIGHO2_02_FULL_50_11]|nr:MAG: hypothetical protein A3C13_00870 [Candidatus Lloydbacteria bacterium RIFCSPHIGHO2_02_FULL_50_11]
MTDAANLTLGFGEAFADLDIELKSTPGSCGYVSHKRASKTCVGDWKDRGGKISGYYYLEVDTWGTAFTAYLYGPNSLPNRDNFGIWSSPPIPKIMLRFFRKR